MNRRGFLNSLVGGVAASVAMRTWPFRVFSFPTEIKRGLGITSVRFVRAFDPIQKTMYSRLDTLYGFGADRLIMPSRIEHGSIISSNNGLPLSQEVISHFTEKLHIPYCPPDRFYIDGFASKQFLHSVEIQDATGVS